MNSSAGLAFAPHVIGIGVGEVCYHFLVHLIDDDDAIMSSTFLSSRL